MLAMASTVSRRAAAVDGGRAQPCQEHTGVLQLAGLSYSLPAAEVAEFWRGVGCNLAAADPVIQRRDHRGRPSDVFFVEFESPEVAAQAMAHNRSYIGGRFFRLALSTQDAKAMAVAEQKQLKRQPGGGRGRGKSKAKRRRAGRA